MTKQELQARIEALEAQVVVLQSQVAARPIQIIQPYDWYRWDHWPYTLTVGDTKWAHSVTTNLPRPTTSRTPRRS